MIDKKGRLFGRVSLVDLFAAVVVAAVFFVVYGFASGGGKPALGEAQPVTLTFFAPALHDFVAYDLTPGVPVTDDDLGTFMGYVTAIERGDSIRFLPNRQGSLVASHMQGYYAVHIHTQVNAQLSDGAVVLNGTLYAIGSEVHLWAGSTRVIAHISNIKAN
jgi:hypothetical protein